MKSFILFFLFLNAHALLVAENTTNYFYVQDECQGVYFILYQSKSIHYAVNYTPFSDIDLIKPKPPFFPQILVENETLLHVTIDRVYQRVHVLTNERWRRFDYNLNEESSRTADGLQLIAYDHFGNLLSCYEETCQTSSSQKERVFSEVDRIQPISENTWLLKLTNGTCFIYTYLHEVILVNEWYLKYHNKYFFDGNITISTSSINYTFPVDVDPKSILHVMNRNLFIFVLQQGSDLILESHYRSLTKAPHQFCEINQNFTFVLRCRSGNCTTEPLSLQEIIAPGEHALFDEPVSFKSLNLTSNATLYLYATINVTTGDLRGDIITDGNHVIRCENCTVEELSVFNENGMEYCLSYREQILDFFPCQATAQEQDNVIYFAAGACLGLVLITAGICYLLMKTKIKHKVFPFRGEDNEED